jgi:hypothetical protein
VSITMSTTLWPLNISFHGVGKLRPLDDITPREAVQICSMLACGSVGSGVDYAKFVKENRLQRHFEQPPTPPGK